MAESTLSIGRAELQREVGRYLGFDRDPTNWTTDETTDVNDIIDSGLRQFYVNPVGYEWNFLRPIRTVTTDAPFSTGTITVVNGVVTLTGGIWPVDAQDYDLTPDSDGITYSVATRDSDTQLTLDDLTLNVATASAFTLARAVYTLPDDFGDIDGPLTYRPGEAAIYPPIQIVKESEIRGYNQRSNYYDSYPRLAAIRPQVHDPTKGTRWELVFWPTPDNEYELAYRSYINPEELTATNVFPVGGFYAAEAVRASCIAAAEEYDDQRGEKWQRFAEVLQAAIEHDKTAGTPEQLGYNADYSDNTWEDRGRTPRRWWGSHALYTGHDLFTG